MMVIIARRDKRHAVPVALRHFKTEYIPIKRQRPFEVGHLEMHVTHFYPGINGS